MNSGEEKITLDRSTFKVLASETRIEILKSLDRSQKTVSDLAREMGMNKATLFQHLEHLRRVGLVKRLDGVHRKIKKRSHPLSGEEVVGERKWVYYRLTWKGRNILHPERVRIAIMLGTVGILAAVILVVMAVNVAPPSEGPVGVKGDVQGPQILWEPSKPGASLTVNVHLSDQSGVDGSSVYMVYAPSQKRYIERPESMGWHPMPYTYSSSSGTVHAALDSSVLEPARGMFIHLYIRVSDIIGNTNESYYAVYIPEPDAPDLSVHWKGLERTPEGWALNFTVSNVGSAPADSFKVSLSGVSPEELNLRYSEARSGGWIVDLKEVPGLSPGENLSLNIAIAEMVRVSATEVYLVADIENTVAEMDEGNNLAAWNLSEYPEFTGKGLPSRGYDGGGPLRSESAKGGAAPDMTLVMVLGAAVVAYAIRRAS